jgi:hypothetical protein
VTPANAPAARAFIGVALVLFVLFGVVWALDRTHRWDDPRLEAPFVAIRGEPPGRSTGRPTWLVPINPLCPSCMARARALSREFHSARMVFLVVDRSRPVPPLALADLEADAIWWDPRGVWRHRWGHRVYGEILRFDSGGHYRGTTPPTANRTAPGQGGEEG